MNTHGVMLQLGCLHCRTYGIGHPNAQQQLSAHSSVHAWSAHGLPMITCPTGCALLSNSRPKSCTCERWTRLLCGARTLLVLHPESSQFEHARLPTGGMSRSMRHGLDQLMTCDAPQQHASIQWTCTVSASIYIHEWCPLHLLSMILMPRQLQSGPHAPS